MLPKSWENPCFGEAVPLGGTLGWGIEPTPMFVEALTLYDAKKVEATCELGPGIGNLGNGLDTFRLDPTKYKNGKDVGKYESKCIPTKGILEGVEVVPIMLEGNSFETLIGCETKEVVTVVVMWITWG